MTYSIYRANSVSGVSGLRLRLRSFSRALLRGHDVQRLRWRSSTGRTSWNYSVDARDRRLPQHKRGAVWSVGQRHAETSQRLTNQLNDVLFPTVVDNDASSRLARLQSIFLIGEARSRRWCRLAALMLMASARQAWVGPDFAGSAIVVQLLA